MQISFPRESTVFKASVVTYRTNRHGLPCELLTRHLSIVFLGLPDLNFSFCRDDGVVVPCGEMVESGVKNAPLYYNEFIVYDVRQIRLRYLVQMKFDYKY